MYDAIAAKQKNHTIQRRNAFTSAKQKRRQKPTAFLKTTTTTRILRTSPPLLKSRVAAARTEANAPAHCLRKRTPTMEARRTESLLCRSLASNLTSQKGQLQCSQTATTSRYIARTMLLTNAVCLTRCRCPGIGTSKALLALRGDPWTTFHSTRKPWPTTTLDFHHCRHSIPQDACPSRSRPLLG